MDIITEEQTVPIMWGTSAMLRVVFKPEKIEKYRALGADVKDDGAVVFGGHFQAFQNSKPCFKLSASTPVEIFGQRSLSYVDLTWPQEDIVSVGFAFSKNKVWWQGDWDMQQLIEGTKN